jgi:hypothetical protein
MNHSLLSDQSGSKWLEPFVSTGDGDRQKANLKKRRGERARENFCEISLNNPLNAPKKAQQMYDAGKKKGKLKAGKTAVRITLEGKNHPYLTNKTGITA